MLSSSTLGAIMAALIASTANAAPVKRDATPTSAAPTPSSPSSGLSGAFGIAYSADEDLGGAFGIFQSADEDLSGAFGILQSTDQDVLCGAVVFDSTTDSTWASQPAAKVEDCMSLLEGLNRVPRNTRRFPSPSAQFWYNTCHVDFKLTSFDSSDDISFVHAKKDLAPLVSDAIRNSEHRNEMIKAKGQILCVDGDNQGEKMAVEFEIKGHQGV
ncbi:hypothetical protein PG985_010783 [Apiospora marii]|uniref:uncharacterized protein n=1 Tax=Apiospora marii TaxID=335849 RepID=UPI00312D0366